MFSNFEEGFPRRREDAKGIRKCLIFLVLLVFPFPLWAKTYSTLNKSLGKAFGDAKIERKTHFLTESQKNRLKEILGEDWDGEIVYAYEAFLDNQLLGTAYLDKHLVRTLRETLMIVLDAKGAVQNIEVLSFYEPEEYKARPKWYAQFFGKKSPDKVKMNRDVQGISGATLTARAGSLAVRRILALHSVLSRKEGS